MIQTHRRDIDAPVIAVSGAWRHRPWLRRWAALALLAVGAVVLAWEGRRAALTLVGQLLIAEDPITAVEMIVVSGVSPVPAALEAARLYHEGVGPKIVLLKWAGEPVDEEIVRLGIRHVGPTELLPEVIERSGVPATAVELLPSAVDGTASEIREVGAFIRARQPASVLFITARSHSARARWLLRRELPATTRLVVRSPRRDWFSSSGWWRHRNQSREVVTEYMRWVNVLIFRDLWRGRTEAGVPQRKSERE